MATPRAVLEARRSEVSTFVLSGFTNQIAIAEAIKRQHPDWPVSQATVSRDMGRLARRFRETSEQNILEAKGKDLDRLERLLQAIWTTAITGSLAAIAEVRGILRDRAKLLGLDEPLKIEDQALMSYMDLIRKADEELDGERV